MISSCFHDASNGVTEWLCNLFLKDDYCCHDVVLNDNDFYMPPTMCQCMWGCLIIQWLAKSQALKKDVTLFSILSLKCSMSTGLVSGPHCALGLIYWTRTQLCCRGFISAHSKLLSCPAVTPLSPPYSHDLTELNAQPPALMPVTWQHCQTQWGLFFFLPSHATSGF